MSKIISIEVSNLQIRICEADYRAKTPKVYKYFSVLTPEGAYEDGAIMNVEAIAEVIKIALASNAVKTKQVVFTVLSGKIATREVLLPDVKMNQVDTLVKTNARDYFPIDLSQYQITELVLGREKDEDGSSRLRTIVMAASKGLLEGYEKLAKACNLRLISIDYSGNSIYQVMKSEIKEDTEMIIKMEERSCLASIVRKGMLVLQRNIVYGIDETIWEVVRHPVFEVNNYNEAYEKMTGKSCLRSSFNADINIPEADEQPQIDERYNQARQDVTASVKTVVNNIIRVLDLYNSKNMDDPVKRICLIGLGSRISGMSRLLSNELGVRTVVMDEIKGVNWVRSQTEGGLGAFVAPIGATVAPVSFVDEESKKNDIKTVNYRTATILSALLILVAAAAMVLLSYMPYKDAQDRNNTLVQKEKAYMEAEEVYKDYQTVSSVYNDILAAYGLTVNSNDNLLNFLKELEQKLPSDSAVKDITSDNDQASITLLCTSFEDAAKLIQTIREFDSVMDVELGNISDGTEDFEEDIIEDVLENAEEKLTKGLADLFGSFEGEYTEEIRELLKVATGYTPEELMAAVTGRGLVLYDREGNPIPRAYVGLDKDGQPIKSRRGEYSLYDENGLPIVDVYALFDAEGNLLTDTYSLYDDYGNRLESNADLFGSDGYPIEPGYAMYDAEGDLVREDYAVADYDGNVIKGAYAIYDEEGNPITGAYVLYDQNLKPMTGADGSYALFNINGQMISGSYELYDKDGNPITPVSETEAAEGEGIEGAEGAETAATEPAESTEAGEVFGEDVEGESKYADFNFLDDPNHNKGSYVVFNLVIKYYPNSATETND